MSVDDSVCADLLSLAKLRMPWIDVAKINKYCESIQSAAGSI
ncbi:hypothetical protein RRSWK_01936 [Rhodopirellula sp. SWK7]|nr:hypothetical protein RRSWK_01936 [Rhodopirellula sp. SWK7]